MTAIFVDLALDLSALAVLTIGVGFRFGWSMAAIVLGATWLLGDLIGHLK